VGAADVDDNAVLGKRLAEEGHIHDIGRAVQLLRGAKDLAGQGVGDHDVVADFDGVHSQEFSSR